MSIFSEAVSKVFGKRNIGAVQSVLDVTAPFIIDAVMTQLSNDDVRKIMNACRRKLRSAGIDECSP